MENAMLNVYLMIAIAAVANVATAGANTVATVATKCSCLTTQQERMQ